MNIDYNFQQPNNYKQKSLFINSITPKSTPKRFVLQKTNNEQQAFGSANQATVKLNGFEKFLNFLSTDMAWGAVLIDLVSMVIPRTFIDFRRDPKAGAETGARESAGTFNHSMIGVYGALAGFLFAQGINKSFNVEANHIFADSLTADTYKDILVNQSKNGAINDREFVISALKSYGDKESKNKDVPEDLARSITDMISSDKKPDKEVKNAVLDKMINYFKTEDGIILKNEKEAFEYSVKNILDSIVSVGKAMHSDKLKSPENIDKFFKALKKMNLRRSILGIAIGSAFGMSVQPLNVYLTKKRTGHSGFVGGGEEDTSTGFKFRKIIAGLGFGAGTLATIGKLKDLAKNLQFQGKTPTIPQIKFIYGMTIVSRLFAARNDNELRESLFKDFLGFVNLLILGAFVQKGVAKALDKDLVTGKNLLKGKLLTRKEVLLSDLANDAKKAKLRKLSIAQLSGYLYSIVVLGTLVPKLNIWMTNRRMQKEKEAAKTKQVQEQNTNFKQNSQLHNTKIQNLHFEQDDTIKKFYSTKTINTSLNAGN